MPACRDDFVQGFHQQLRICHIGTVAVVNFIEAPPALSLGSLSELPEWALFRVTHALNERARNRQPTLQAERLLKALDRLRQPVTADPGLILRRRIARSRIRCDTPA